MLGQQGVGYLSKRGEAVRAQILGCLFGGGVDLLKHGDPRLDAHRHIAEYEIEHEDGQRADKKQGGPGWIHPVWEIEIYSGVRGEAEQTSPDEL